MTWHTGRLIDHVHLRVADVEASKRFYTALLETLGLAIAMSGMAISRSTSCSCPVSNRG